MYRWHSRRQHTTLVGVNEFVPHTYTHVQVAQQEAERQKFVVLKSEQTKRASV